MAFPVDYIDKVQDYFPTGSRVICDPPILNTDEDWVVKVYDSQSLREFKKLLKKDGWELCGAEYENQGFGNMHNGKFVAFRKGELNLIITESAVVYDRYKIATRVATKLNLISKDDRIALFQMIRDHNFATNHWGML